MDSQELKLLRDIIRGIPELVLVVSESGKYLEVGGLSEHEPDDIVGRSLHELFPTDIVSVFEKALSDAFSAPEESVKTIEYQLSPSPDLKISLPDNEPRTYELKINPISVTSNQERIAVCICRDVTDIRNREKTLKILSERDPLTGVYNRSKLFERLELSFNEQQRYGTLTSFLLLDLDDFKNINDRYGHLAGDRALNHFVSILTSEHRTVDTFARLGGDEFALLMPNTNESEAFMFAERVRERVSREKFIYEGSSIPMSVSIGIGEIDKNDKDIEAVVLRADQAMYFSKHNRKSSSTLNGENSVEL